MGHPIALFFALFLFFLSYMFYKEEEENKRSGIKKYFTNGIITLPDSFLIYWSFLMGLGLLFVFFFGPIN